MSHPAEIVTKGGSGFRVVLRVLGPAVNGGGYWAYPVTVQSADGPYYCTGYHVLSDAEAKGAGLGSAVAAAAGAYGS